LLLACAPSVPSFGSRPAIAGLESPSVAKAMPSSFTVNPRTFDGCHETRVQVPGPRGESPHSSAPWRGDSREGEIGLANAPGDIDRGQAFRPLGRAAEPAAVD